MTEPTHCTLKCFFCSVALLTFLSACQIAAPSIPHELHKNSEMLHSAESFQSTISDIANGGGNLGRLAALKRRIEAKGLNRYLTKQHIDWYGLQQNLIVEVPGKSQKIIYFTAHYDKTDANPLTFISLMFNGILDTALSPFYFSDGALDNATGVSVVLELANRISKQENYYTYRFLFVGSEETGLHGSRVHVARLSHEEKSAIKFAVNIDTVGVKGTENCLTLGVSDPQLSYYATAAANSLNYNLGYDPYPIASTSDYLSFQEISTSSDFTYGLQLNFVGGILPQRSWFSSPSTVPVMNFSSCGIMTSSSGFITNFLLPIGQLHSYRDSTDLVDINGLYELNMIINEMLNNLEKNAMKSAPLYRVVNSDGISSLETSEN